MPCTLESDNPYAALHQDEDDSDDDAQKQEKAPTLPLFRLAPPTFAFGTNDNNDDFDPDL